jgi:hypothetical protein
MLGEIMVKEEIVAEVTHNHDKMDGGSALIFTN